MQAFQALKWNEDRTIAGQIWRLRSQSPTDMGRRNRDYDVASGIAQLVGVIIIAGMIHPGMRSLVLGLGHLVVLLVALAACCLAVFVVCRMVARRNAHGESIIPTPLQTPFGGLGQETKPNQILPANMIKKMREIDWFQFEKAIGAIFSKQGYQVEHRGGANPDGGIDLVLVKNGERTAVQCKHWKSWNLGVKVVREFLGAMTDAGIKNGIVATLSGYSAEAKNLAEKHGIEILNEAGVTRMLEMTGAFQDRSILAILDDTTKYCPKCGHEMVPRTAGRGINAGSKFWGCSTYPRCRFTMPA